MGFETVKIRDFGLGFETRGADFQFYRFDLMVCKVHRPDADPTSAPTSGDLGSSDR